MKKLVYVLLALGVLVGGLFALFEDKIFIDIPEDVMSNLELRYGEGKRFKFVEYIPEESTENSRAMRINSKYGEFKLIRYFDGKGVVHYNDTYLGCLYKDLIEDDIKEVLSSYLKDKTVDFKIDLDGSSFPDNTRFMIFPDLLKDPATFIKVNIVSTFKWSDTHIEQFAELLSNGVGMRVVVTLLESDNLIDFKDFDSVMISSESIGNKVFFSVGKNAEILYTNRE